MDLLQAAATGDRDSVEALIAQHGKAIVNKRGPNKLTALMAAATQGHLDVVQMLIDAGAKLDLRDEDGQTALMHAICQQNAAIVDALLDAGARADIDKWLAFDFAVRLGTPAMVRRLIAQGANVNRRNGEDPPPLFDALERGNNEIIERLLEAGADPTIMAGGQSPASIAAAHGDGALLQRLLEAGSPPGPALMNAVYAGKLELVHALLEAGANVNQADSDFGFTPLSTAIETGNAEVAAALLEAGAHVDTTDWLGQTPLYAAVASGHTDLARVLIDAGADVNARTSTGETVLHAAVSSKHEAILHQLIDRGADVNGAGPGTPPPLHLAVAHGELQAVRLLLAAGADVNAGIQKSRGTNAALECPAATTPIMIAAREGNTALVDLLLEAGADPERRNSRKQTAAQFAEQAGHVAILDRLAHAGATVDFSSKRLHNAALLNAVKQGDEGAVAKALAAGADPETPRTQSEETALMAACREGHTAIAKALLNAGADPNATSKYGATPLRYAVVRGWPEVVRVLLAAGADPNRVTGYYSVPSGKGGTVIPSLATVLMDAAHYGHSDILELLLEAGADPSLGGGPDTTPLVAAITGRHIALAQRLADAGAEPRPEDAPYLDQLEWEARAAAPDYRSLLDKVTDVCGVEGTPMTNMPGMVSYPVEAPGREAAPAGDTIEATIAWSKQWSADYAALTEQMVDLLDILAESAAAHGYHVIDGGMPPGCGPMRRYLYALPTADKYAVLAALGVRGNEMEWTTRDIIDWFRAFEAENPFTLRGCSFDTVTVALANPIENRAKWAKALCAFCPDSFEAPRDVAKSLEAARHLTFWWD